jgi:hypothetical protein
VLVEELAYELEALGRDAFRAQHGQHFLVFASRGLIDDAAEFVNTASRSGSDILAGRGREVDVHPIAKARVTVGRGEDSDVRIKHPRVSSLHAVFTLGGGLLFLTDAHSRNGTQVNGAPLAPDAPAPVDVGDLVQFGPVQATVWGLDDLFAAARR